MNKDKGKEDASGLVMGGLVLVGLVIGMWRDDITEWVILSVGVGLLIKAWMVSRTKKS